MRCRLVALAVALLGVAAVPVPVNGQGAGFPGGDMGFNAAVAQLFKDIPAFTAETETVVSNPADRSQVTLPMRLMKRQDQFRLEVDLIKMKGSGVAMQGVPMMQNLGLARMATLVQPGQRSMTVLFPELKYYTRIAMADADLPKTEVRIDKRSSGRDTISGQSCVRQRVTMTAPDGEKTEATVWEAPQLGNFPMRIEMKPADGAMRMTFSEVKLAPPNNSLFEVPKDYQAFNSIGALMQAATARAFRPAGAR